VSDDYSTLEVARLLGMAVRSVQMMVDRGELEAWKTPGGHRRISRGSVERWRASRQQRSAETGAGQGGTRPAGPVDSHAGGTGAGTSAGTSTTDGDDRPAILLIEDSIHYQNLITLLVRQQFPQAQLHVADDGIAGLAMAGRLQPRVMIVDILLPGIDGATLITSLRSHPQFNGIQLIVVTSLDEDARAPYAFALAGLPVVHKARLVADLPAHLTEALARTQRQVA
jgi:excisionase family DNA binding protein